jgi:carbonic anhydrase
MAQTPEMRDLFSTNAHWVAEETATRPDIFRRCAGEVHPRLLWIGCSDNHLSSLEIAPFLDQGCLVHRNLANQAPEQDANFLATLEYAVSVVKVSRVVICGHYGCRCLAGLLSGQASLSNANWLTPVRSWLRENAAQIEAIATVEGRLQMFCEANVQEQVRRLARNPLIARGLAAKSIELQGVIWSPRDGLLRDAGVPALRASRPPRTLPRLTKPGRTRVRS